MRLLRAQLVFLGRGVAERRGVEHKPLRDEVDAAAAVVTWTGRSTAA